MKKNNLFLGTVALIAFSLQLSAQPTVNVRSQINFSDNDHYCASDFTTAAVPVDILADFTNIPSCAPLQFLVIRPDGVPFVYSSTLTDGQVPMHMGDVAFSNTAIFNGTYQVSVDYGCPNVHLEFPLTLKITTGPLTKVTIAATGINNGDGSATIKAELAPQFPNYVFNVDWKNGSGQIIGTNPTFQSFTAVSSAVVTDPGGCSQLYTCSTSPTGVPIAPLLNVNGTLGPLTWVYIKNIYKKVTYILQTKNGAIWTDAPYNSVGTVTFLPGEYRFKATNTNSGESFSQSFKVKWFGHMPSGDDSNAQAKIAEVSDRQVVEYAVIDMNGKVVRPGTRMPIDLTGLSRGYYVEKIIYDNHDVETITVFVESNNFVQLIK